MVDPLLKTVGMELEADLDWRNSELATLRELLTVATQPEIRKRALYRAAWALLYAHYEGFVKFSLELYIDSLSRLLNTCSAIPDKMFVYFMEKEIRAARNLKAHECFKFFSIDMVNFRAQAPKAMTVDTKSNLWPALLQELFEKLDLDSHNISIDVRKLKTLVARRNDIAHGKKAFIQDMAYYLEYERVVVNLMYELALAIVDRFEKFAGSRPC